MVVGVGISLKTLYTIYMINGNQFVYSMQCGLQNLSNQTVLTLSTNLYRPVATIGPDLGFQAFVRQNSGMDCAETVLVANTECQNERRDS